MAASSTLAVARAPSNWPARILTEGYLSMQAGRALGNAFGANDAGVFCGMVHVDKAGHGFFPFIDRSGEITGGETQY